jgi:hypothetical protein
MAVSRAPGQVTASLSASLRDVEERAERATVRGINKWAERVLRRAKQLAPIGPPRPRNELGQFTKRRLEMQLGEETLHPGHLRNSGVLTKAELDAYPLAEVAFTAVYAARQHEEVTWKHPQGGQAKYLEAAFKELIPELPAMVRYEVEVELETVTAGRVQTLYSFSEEA